MVEVNLQDVLVAKERLASLQAELRQRYELPVVSMTTNIPGTVKDSSDIRNLLRTAVNKFRTSAENKGLFVSEERIFYLSTGPAAIMAVDGDPYQIKKTGIEVEESANYGRLLDIDVFDANGRQISRTTLNYPERTCFLCADSAVLCRRSGKHSSQEVHDSVRSRIADFKAEATNAWPAAVWDLGNWAIEAMLMEAACTPAPGLVDRDNPGAHKDMDFFTFLMSSSALSGSMFRCAAAGYSHQGSLPDLLPILRRIGLDGEAQMLAATKGVNTQKGLLFLLGILAAAAAHIAKHEPKIDSGKVLDAATAICSGIVSRELEPLAKRKGQNLFTAGEKLYVKYGVTGIRGEVEAGLPSVREFGLPVLKSALESGLSLNDALVHTLISLMTVVQDTTVLNRHGLDDLLYMQKKAKEAIEIGGMYAPRGKDKIRRLDEEFIAKNISPGGVADLLAATYFLHVVETKHLILL